ncbi:MAG: hypothetical protein DMF19_13245, partial [Verrucomicrobia bacterium]
SLVLSALASLRETSAIQGSEEFFTLRREGAKKAYESKQRISFLNLGGFATLREIAATDAFSRQGAKAQRTEDCNGGKPKPWQP